MSRSRICFWMGFFFFFWSPGAEVLFASRLQVSYWRDGDQEESGRKQRTAKNETSMVLTGLEGNSMYLVAVKGFNSIGQGPATAAVTARTRRAREWSPQPTRVTQHSVCVWGVGGWGDKRCSRVLLVWPSSSCTAAQQPRVDPRRQQRVPELGPGQGERERVGRHWIHGSHLFFKVPLENCLWVCLFFFNQSVNQSAFNLHKPTEPLYNPCKCEAEQG